MFVAKKDNALNEKNILNYAENTNTTEYEIGNK